MTSQPGVGAAWKIVHGYMADKGEDDHIKTIEDYVDGLDNGVTRRAMRFAGGLPIVPVSSVSAAIPSAPFDPVADALRQMRRNSDLLIGHCLDNDIEYMTEAHCRLAICIPGANPSRRKAYFQQLVDNGFWVKSLKPQGNAHQTYIPVVSLAHGLQSVFPAGSPPTQGPLPETIHLQQLRRAHSNPNRVHNVRVLIDMYNALRDMNAPGAGRQTRAAKASFDEAASMVRKLEGREELCKRNLAKCSAALGPVPPVVGGKVRLDVSYVTKYDRFCRARADPVGVQGMSKVSQKIANPELLEIDMVAAEWTFLPQIAQRIGIQLDHPVSNFANIKSVPQDKATIANGISPIFAEAKHTCLSVLNGSAIPDHLASNAFLQGVRKEGRLWRWIACSLDPELHKHLVADGSKPWPENTVLFYVWTGAEAWCVKQMATHSLASNPSHLSLHNDGIKMDCSQLQIPVSVYVQHMQDAILQETGYTINLAQKEQRSSLDIIDGLEIQGPPSASDPLLLKPGNCIMAAIHHSNLSPTNIVTLLRKRNQANQDAEESGGRTYRECQGLCKVQLIPVAIKDLHTAVSYVVHIESGNQPHAILLTIAADGLCTLTNRALTRQAHLTLLMTELSKAVDYSSLRFFEIRSLNHHTPVNPPYDKLLDLRAGSADETTPSSVFLDSCQKEVDDYISELDKNRYRNFNRHHIGKKVGNKRHTKSTKSVKKSTKLVQWGDNFCKLCPLRSFERPIRLRAHVPKHHARKDGVEY